MRFCRLLVVFSLLSTCSVVSAESKESGWTPLFNKKDFSGWYIISGSFKKNDDPNHLFQIHDGMVHIYKDADDRSNQPSGYIVTEKEYSNYHLRFQYKWGTKKFGAKVDAQRDAGLLYHVIGPDGVWPKSVECQVQEGDTGDIFTVNTRVVTTVDPTTTNQVSTLVTNASSGEIKTNSSVRPKFLDAKDGGVEIVQGVSGGIRRVMRNPENEKEGWNTVEVITRGSSSTHLINGKVNNKILRLEEMVDGK
ncbi:MAG: DUF1080 domain-containing protein [Verrucomicrobiota bacterium]